MAIGKIDCHFRGNHGRKNFDGIGVRLIDDRQAAIDGRLSDKKSRTIDSSPSRRAAAAKW